jgi:hypothetical protein
MLICSNTLYANLNGIIFLSNLKKDDSAARDSSVAFGLVTRGMELLYVSELLCVEL